MEKLSQDMLKGVSGGAGNQEAKYTVLLSVKDPAGYDAQGDGCPTMHIPPSVEFSVQTNDPNQKLFTVTYQGVNVSLPADKCNVAVLRNCKKSFF